MFEKAIALIASLVTIRHVWHSGTKEKHESELKRLEKIRKRRGGS